MKFLIKIEDFINKILIFIIEKIQKLLILIAPKKLLVFYQHYFETIEDFKKRILEFKSSFKNNFRQYLIKKKNAAKDLINNLIQIVKKNIDEFKTYLGTLENLKSPKTCGKILCYLFKRIFTWGKIFFDWYFNLKPVVMLAGIIIFLALSFYSIKSYFENKKLRSIAYIEQNIKPLKPEELSKVRPIYYKGDKKQILMQEIVFPFYLEKINQIKSLSLDIIIKSSNRNIINHISKKEHAIRDRLNSSFEPIISDFPLQEEGKKMIKEKILDELNLYLQEQKIEGEIEEIYIDNLIAS